MAEVTAISWTQGVGTVVTSLMAISKQHLDTCALTAVNASGTAACNQSHSHSHAETLARLRRREMKKYHFGDLHRRSTNVGRLIDMRVGVGLIACGSAARIDGCQCAGV